MLYDIKISDIFTKLSSLNANKGYLKKKCIFNPSKPGVAKKKKKKNKKKTKKTKKKKKKKI